MYTTYGLLSLNKENHIYYMLHQLPDLIDANPQYSNLLPQTKKLQLLLLSDGFRLFKAPHRYLEDLDINVFQTELEEKPDYLFSHFNGLYQSLTITDEQDDQIMEHLAEVGTSQTEKDQFMTQYGLSLSQVRPHFNKQGYQLTHQKYGLSAYSTHAGIREFKEEIQKSIDFIHSRYGKEQNIPCGAFLIPEAFVTEVEEKAHDEALARKQSNSVDNPSELHVELLRQYSKEYEETYLDSEIAEYPWFVHVKQFLAGEPLRLYVKHLFSSFYKITGVRLPHERFFPFLGKNRFAERRK